MTNDKPTKPTIVTDTSASSVRMFAPDARSVIKDPIDLSPDLQGPHGKAWICNTARLWEVYNVDPKKDACIVHWIVEAPWAHPIWHSYSVIVIHLRPLPGVPDPTMYKEDATHQLWVWAINDEIERLPTIKGDKIQKRFWLQPKNFGAQFIETSDETALERIKGTVQMICDGALSPDADYIRDWGRLFGFNMVKDEYK